ncbi:MAG: hypothetical protein NZM00_12615, partial [Anaerolinea sp.]|nr:hypothetical protein [Anaerolinea sp.]
RLAAWLSSLEGAFWGMRLPRSVVARCLQYHTAAYPPVALVANLLVWGYLWLLERAVLTRATGVAFAFTLSGAVIIAAGYLFGMYLIAMRQIRYANQ